MLNKNSSLATSKQVLLTICWQGASERSWGIAKIGDTRTAQGE